MTDVRQDDLSFCPPLAAMASSGVTVDRNGAPTEARGLSTVNNLIVLRNILAEIRPSATLEVGLAYGASALVFAQSMKDFGAPPPEGQHVAIDPFQSDMGGSGLAVVQAAGLAGYLRHVEAFSDQALPALLAHGARFGVIYVDGSHLFEDVFIDCWYAAQLLEPGGVVLFDDSSDAHVAKALSFVRSNMGHVLSEIGVGPYRAGGDTLRYRLGKALGRVQLSAFRKTGEGRRPWDARLQRF